MEPCGVILKEVIDKYNGKSRVGLCLYQEDDSRNVTLVLIAVVDPEVTHRYKFSVDGECSIILKKPRRWWEFWK